MAKPRFFYGWVIVALAAVSLGLGYSIWYSFTVFFLAVIQEFGWSRADTALAFSVFVIGHGVSGPPVGMLVGRFGLRRVMPVGALFLAASLAACSLVNTRWQYYLAFGVLSSFGVTAVGTVPNYAALNRWFVKRRGLVLGLASAGIGALGISILVPVNQYLISTIGWRETYLVLAATMAVVLAPLTYLLQRERPQDMGLLPDGVRAAPAPGQAGSGRALDEERVAVDRRWLAREWTTRQAMHTWRFWVLCTAFFLLSLAIQTVFVHEAAYFVDLGHSQFLAAGVIGFIGLFSIAAKIGWGWASDHFGREITCTMGVACLIVSLLLLLLMPGLPGQWLLYVFAVFFAFGYGMQAPLQPAITGDLFPGKHFPVIYSFSAISMNVGSAVGPWVAGYLFDLGGSYAPAFFISIAVAVLSCASVWLIAPRRVHIVVGRAARRAARPAARLG